MESETNEIIKKNEFFTNINKRYKIINVKTSIVKKGEIYVKIN